MSFISEWEKKQAEDAAKHKKATSTMQKVWCVFKQNVTGNEKE